MLKIDEVITVEGKYDRIKLSRFIDATIIETSGFRIYNNAALRKLLADSAEKRGLIVLTDSDNAGFQIRRYLRSFINDKYIRNVYVPAIKGKEKRKRTASASGILGVEGLSEEIIYKAFSDAGIETGKPSVPTREKFDTIDFYRLGLSGKRNSRNKLKLILQMLGLPEQMSTRETMDVLSLYMTKAEFADFCSKHASQLSAFD